MKKLLTIAQGLLSPSQQYSLRKTQRSVARRCYPNKNIVQNAMNSKEHTTLFAAVKAAGLVDTLEGGGPFTVFAPTTKPSRNCRLEHSIRC